MNAFAELLNQYPQIMEKAGFYVFFLGLLLILAVLLPVLFEKERLLLPSIIISFLLVAGAAWALEYRGMRNQRKNDELFRVVYVKERVEVMVPVTVEVQVPREPARQRAAPPPGERTTVSMQPVSTPVPAPSPVRVKPPYPKPEPIKSPARETEAAHEPGPQPAAPATQPRVAEQPPAPAAQPAVATTQQPAPPSSPPPKREPEPTGERIDNALILPTGTLVIKIASTMLFTVPGKASKARLGIYIDGNYVGGKNASGFRAQEDDRGNVMNVTYFWKGLIVTLTNQPTGNRKVRIGLKVSGDGFSKAKTAWSGTVRINENNTTTVVLEGDSGDTLTRVQ